MSIDTPMALLPDTLGEDLAKELVCEKYNRDLFDVSDHPLLKPEAIRVIWYLEGLSNNWSAILRTGRTDDHLYELIHNSRDKTTIITVYTPLEAELIRDEDR